MLRVFMKSSGFLFLLCALLLTCFTAEAAERKVKLNISAWATLAHPTSVYFSQKPGELLNALSGNKFDIRIHPSNTLVSMKDCYQSVISGITPFNLIWPSGTPGVFPLLDLFSLPGLFPNQATSNAVAMDLYEKYPQFKASFDPAVEPISIQVHMRADLHTRTPIRTLADLKGKTIGCQSPQLAEALAALGASVSVLDVSDGYTSLDKGVIDGMACAWGTVSAYRLFEVAKFHTLIGICPAPSAFLVNKKVVWDVLTPEQQALFKLQAPTLQNYITEGNVLSSMDVRYNQASPAQGHEIITWGPEDMASMRERFRPIWDKWADTMEKQGVPAKAILEDAIQLIDAYTYG